MAPRRELAAATVISTYVKSDDRASILVEAGGFAPVHWFLGRGSKHLSGEEPPQKRRKLRTEGADVVIEQTPLALESSARILLYEGIVDLSFEVGTRSPDASDFVDSTELPITLVKVVSDEGFDTIELALPEAGSPILTIEVDTASKNVTELLRSSLFTARSLSHRSKDQLRLNPGTFVVCSLSRSNTDEDRTLRLKASLFWRSGSSAFPFGSPRGTARVYQDYDILTAAFPNRARSGSDQDQVWTPRDFYDSVPATEKSVSSIKISNNALESVLYPFQNRAVTWLLRREGIRTCGDQFLEMDDEERRCQGISIVEKATDLDGGQCFVDHLRGVVTRQMPEDGICNVSGGLLAEEMGLGKTVELMALIALHRRPGADCGVQTSDESGIEVLHSKATLIVTPTAILPQWKSELQRHAPNLRVFHYEGVPGGNGHAKKAPTLLQELCCRYDVVLATYHTLAKEIHFAEDPPDRDMRHARRFERKRSPLVQIQWWRVCLDEAQMLESGVTNAAKVACRLPRVHSWAVSGTPLRKDVQDLHGLLIFLRFRPFNESASLWSHLVTNHRHIFRQIFHKIALRHTKTHIHDELTLPPQKRVIIHVPFNGVEQQNYTQLFDTMCEEIGLNRDGSPREGDWDPDDASVIENMRSWLTRLRQTCLHSRLGSKNSNALGRTAVAKRSLQTVEQVLDAMIAQNESSLRQEERTIVGVMLLKAHILCNNQADAMRAEKALPIFEAARAASAKLVKEARERLASAKSSASQLNSTTSIDSEDENAEQSSELGSIKHNLRNALELQHTCLFFLATVHYQIKTDVRLNSPESPRYMELNTLESELYDSAKVIRQELLRECARRAESSMKRIEKNIAVTLPKQQGFNVLGGFESRKIAEKAAGVFDIISQQIDAIVMWRDKVRAFLAKPLVDKDDDTETTGEEYEESTKQQDELYAYLDALNAIEADLKIVINGHMESAMITDSEVKVIIQRIKTYLDPEAQEWQKSTVHAPELALKLFAVRDRLRAQMGEVGSVHGLRQEARTALNSLQINNSNARAPVERHILQRHHDALQNMYSSWTTKILPDLANELKLLQNTQNQRLEFYRQLQEISDRVAPYKEELDATLDIRAWDDARAHEERVEKSLAQLRTKNRFLMHLRDESDTQIGPKICVICQSTFERGVLTVCGHQYCKDCIQHWFVQSKTCPICKRRITRDDYHDIRVTAKELHAKEETSDTQDNARSDVQGMASATVSRPSIYTTIDSDLMNKIKSIELPVSYGTKIDTLGRHLHYIRSEDAGAKSLIFSQYREFLDMLAAALRHFKIGFARFGQASAAEKFKNDSTIDCLLLDAKTDSSGLTLVAATHVFICEPLVQTAVELQAIARVHRIGQTRPTTIWMYLVTDTVEESIYELSVARRLAHVRSRTSSLTVRPKEETGSRSTTPEPSSRVQENVIDAANSEELQSAPLSKFLVNGKSGGERVANEDLWQCLFGKTRAAPREPS